MIKIKNIKIKSPSEYTVSNMDIVEGETRNAKGYLFAERIASKVKIELKWNYLTKEDAALIVNTLKSTFFFDVEFIDLDGVKKTKRFYAGDKSGGALFFRKGKIHWQDFKFNLIER